MYLADTNLVSESNKPTPAQSVLDWLRRNEEDLFLPSIVIAELQFGVADLEDGRKKAALNEWLLQVREKHQDSILPFTESTAVVWGNLMASLRRKSRQMEFKDGIVAATAIEHGLTVVTRNERHFSGTGVKVFNPWK